MPSNGSAPSFADDLLRVQSFPLTRSGLAAVFGRQFGGNRNVWDEYGYLRRDLTFKDYFARYERQDIARRIINMPAEDTWHAAPAISDDEDPEQQSPFERSWGALVRRHQVWNRFEKADRLAGIGHYAVILIGLRGQNRLDQPARPVGGPDDVVFLKPYSEQSAAIDAFVETPTDPRYGEPEYYEIDLASDERMSLKSRKVKVHHSRVIHVAEDTLEDEVYGAPRLQHVYNLLMDLEKVVGASAEIFYRAAWGGKQFDLDPELQLAPEDEKNMAEELDEYQHKLRRFIRTRGVKVTDLTGQMGDPRPSFLVIQDLISAATGIPQRILFGSERGQLASEQDTTAWRSRIQQRQRKFAEPVVVRPFVDRLIGLNVLTQPNEGHYEVKWPPITGQTQLDRIREVALMARANRDHAQAMLPEIYSAEELRERSGLKREMPNGERTNRPVTGPVTTGDRDVTEGTDSADANA